MYVTANLSNQDSQKKWWRKGVYASVHVHKSILGKVNNNNNNNNNKLPNEKATTFGNNA
jgi:hypothetical protein